MKTRRYRVLRDYDVHTVYWYYIHSLFSSHLTYCMCSSCTYSGLTVPEKELFKGLRKKRIDSACSAVDGVTEQLDDLQSLDHPLFTSRYAYCCCLNM